MLCLLCSAISQLRRVLRRFFNAEDAMVGAEERRGHVSSATLCENLCGLCVESGCPPVWLRLRSAVPLRLIPTASFRLGCTRLGSFSFRSLEVVETFREPYLGAGKAALKSSALQTLRANLGASYRASASGVRAALAPLLLRIIHRGTVRIAEEQLSGLERPKVPVYC